MLGEVLGEANKRDLNMREVPAADKSRTKDLEE